MAIINGTTDPDTLNGNPNESDNIFGDGGGDTITIGETNSALYFDYANGGEGDDTIIIRGVGEGEGGPGADRIIADPIPDFPDNTSFVSYVQSPAGISANLTSAAYFGLAGGDTTNGFRVADGFGSVDLVFGVTFLQGSNFDDQIRIDSTYLSAFGSFAEVRPNGGDDTVTFDGVSTARVSYFRSGGAVSVDMQAGTATDRNPSDNFIGADTFSGANQFRGSNFDDLIFGAAGNELLNGSGGKDEIDGRGGDDILWGMGGDDLLTGGAGNDTLDGGNGNDAFYGPQPGAVTVNLLTGTATDGHGGTDTLISIESGHGSFFNDTIIMSNFGGYWFSRGGSDTVTGGDGDEIHLPGSGADTIDARGGLDTISYFDDSLTYGVDVDGGGFITQGATIDLAAGTATDGWGFADTILNFENAEGTQFADTITGTGGSNRLIGFDGDDMLDGGVAESATVFDFLDGGDGDDTITVRGLGTAFGGAGDDRIIGVTVSTGPTDERDYVEAAYFNSTSGIVANLSASAQGGLAGGDNSDGFRIADGLGGLDLVSNIHTVADTSFDDQFFIDSTFRNGFGNWIEIKLSGGDDTVVFDDVATAGVSYQTAKGPVLLDLGAGTATDLNEGDNFIGEDMFAGAIRARGTSFNDEMRGGDGADQLRGRLGNDLLIGGAGDDLLYGDERTPSSNGGDDTLDGGAGNDQIHGGAGNDVAVFSLARSAYGFSIFGAGIRVSELAAGDDGVLERDDLTGIEVLRFADGDVAASTLVTTDIPSDDDDIIELDDEGGTVDGGGGDDYIVGGDGENILDGGEGVDTLIGGSAGDTLEGGEGADILLGGDGDDTYFVDDTFDLVDEGYVFPEFGFGGDDTIQSTATWFWDVYGIAETLVIAEGANDPDGVGTTAIGGVFDNEIVGNSGTNVLFGRGGSDTFRAGDGVDFISLNLLGVGGLYDGVGGVNTIVVEQRASGPLSYDIVFEFESGKDRLDVSDYGFASAAEAFATGVNDGAGNAYFVLGDGLDYLYMVGLTLEEMNAGDFIV